MSFRTSLTALGLVALTMAIAAPMASAKDHRANHEQRNGNARVVGHCPPGLAKKDPACVPPGQARATRDHYQLRVGDVIDLQHVHIVTRPGLYGLDAPRSSDRYAVVNGRLVRVDESTGKILTIIRLVEAILD